MMKRIADVIFRWFCRKDYYLDIRGDLEENYRKHLESRSMRMADLLYLKEVLLLLRPSLIRSRLFFITYNQSGMLHNYLKIAIRNLKRQKGYTSINVLGLSTGIISLFFIFIFIESELSYDKHHEDGDRLFRVSTEMTLNGEFIQMSTSPPGLSRRMKSDFPEVDAVTRIVSFLGIEKNILRVGDRSFSETEGFLTDPNFLEIFSYPVLAGDKQTMLSEPQSIVLSKSLSDKIFDQEDPMSQLITIINDYGTSEYKVTGVYNDEGVRSHLMPAFLCSMNSGSIGRFVYGNDRFVGNNFLYTYVKLASEANVGEVSSKIPSFIKRYAEDAEHSFRFEPVNDIYLYSNAQNERTIGGDIRYIYILSSIAVLILAIACVNFANMATAQASKRSREIGVRKTFGAGKRMIIQQFLGESGLITFLALVFSIIVILLLSPSYATLTGKEVSVNMVLTKAPYLMLIGLITSLLAGSYPAFYLSALKLKEVLGGGSGHRSGSFFVRKVLVVFQFVVGILMIVGALVTMSQLRFIESKSLGFDRSGQVVIPLQSEEAIDQLEKVKSTFTGVPGVNSVAGVTYTPAQFVLSDNYYSLSRSGSDEDRVAIRQNDVDFSLIETLGFQLIDGRTFSTDRKAESSSSVVLNETAVAALGVTSEEIIDKFIYTYEGDSAIAYRVIGVVEDFHSQSLHRPIEPYLFAMRPGRGVSSVVVRLENANYSDILPEIESSWEKLFPTLPFEFHFLDDQLSAQYDQDTRFGQVITLFTGVALVLCLIGIFALTSFTVQESLKEISIRKVLGASVQNIFSSLVVRFLTLIIIASFIAIPAGMIIMNKWLDLFAYHIELGVFLALVPMVIIVLSSLAVISYKLFFAARLNPSVILRGE